MTLENIIWEAKQRPTSLRDSRRPSTTVDETGCTVVKGFVVPSRSSSLASLDSIAISTASSHDTPGTPLSPIEDASPGFSLPSGSLFDAPELRCLKGEYTRSLHRPTKSVGSIEFGRKPFRPTIGPRRSTWQQPSSRWRDEDGAKTKHKSNLSLKVESERSQIPASLPQTTPCFNSSPTGMRRILHVKAAPDHFRPAKRKDSKATSVEDADIDTAIASDSDSDDEDESPRYGLTMGGIAAQRLRPTYATRRALSDQRVAQKVSNVDTAAEHEQTAVSAVTFALSSRDESAIDSDSDEDDDSTEPCKADEHVTAALDLARLHRSRNSITTVIKPDETGKTTRTQSSRPETERVSTLRAKFVPTRLQDGSCETPIEVRSFVPQSPMAHRPMRPSRSQPPPPRGVLKNSCSQGHSAPTRGLQKLTTTSRRGSASFIVSPTKSSSTLAVQKTDSTTACNDISLRFAMDESTASSPTAIHA